MKAGYAAMALACVAMEKEGNSEFGIYYGDSINKVDDGLSIRVEGREVSE